MSSFLSLQLTSIPVWPQLKSVVVMNSLYIHSKSCQPNRFVLCSRNGKVQQRTKTQAAGEEAEKFCSRIQTKNSHDKYRISTRVAEGKASVSLYTSFTIPASTAEIRHGKPNDNGIIAYFLVREYASPSQTSHSSLNPTAERWCMLQFVLVSDTCLILLRTLRVLGQSTGHRSNIGA